MRIKKLVLDKAYINGQWVDAINAESSEVVNPANNKKIGSVPNMSSEDAELAVAAAHAAQKGWANRSAEYRCSVLIEWFNSIQDYSSELAKIITMECGKPIAESIGEVSYGASFVQWFAEEGRRTYGETIPSPSTDKRMYTIKQPIGVCVAITPWNFPLAMITRKVAPALAAGCSIIVKPSEYSPLTALALAKLGEMSGIPDGVLQVITTDKSEEVGEVFTSDNRIRKLTFTGSTPVGKLLMSQCASTMKKVSLELGGNAPFIVFEDADIDAAVLGAIRAKYRNTGQTCVCVNRFLVHENIKDEFVSKLKDAVSKFVIGDGKDPKTQIGPVINSAGLAKVESHVNDALSKGASLILGGQPHKLGGNFYEPTILADVDKSMAIAIDETFGPIAAVFTFKSEQEAVDMANDTEFGLASYFYTESISRVIRVSEKLEYGMVGVNEGLMSTTVAPFGGIKESGLGREGSKHGIDEYMELKYVCVGNLL